MVKDIKLFEKALGEFVSKCPDIQQYRTEAIAHIEEHLGKLLVKYPDVSAYREELTELIQGIPEVKSPDFVPELRNLTNMVKEITEKVGAQKEGVSKSDPSLKAVRYVGKKAKIKDHLYHTGVWETGTVKNVPTETAVKLLRHPDVYSEADSSTPVAETVKEIPVDPEIQKMKEIAEVKRSVIQVEIEGITTPKQLREYSREKLNGWEPDGRLSDPGKIREAIRNHVFQVNGAGLS